MDFRNRVLEQLHLLANPGAQLEYEESLTVAGHAPTELVAMFCDDVYHPKNPAFIDDFSDDELRGLAHLYGLLVEIAYFEYATVAQMLKDLKWHRIIEVSRNLTSQLTNSR